MPALYTQMRKEPGFTREAQKLRPKQSSSNPTALPRRYTDHESSHVPATNSFIFSLNHCFE